MSGSDPAVNDEVRSAVEDSTTRIERQRANRQSCRTDDEPPHFDPEPRSASENFLGKSASEEIGIHLSAYSADVEISLQLPKSSFEMEFEVVLIDARWKS